MGVTVTETAAKHIANQLLQRGKGKGVRVGIKTSGCSGLGYVLEFVDSAETHDVCCESRGVTIFIDPKSLIYVDGTELDFVKEGLNEGFQFNNPNVKNQCGCGESFNV